MSRAALLALTLALLGCTSGSDPAAPPGGGAGGAGGSTGGSGGGAGGKPKDPGAGGAGGEMGSGGAGGAGAGGAAGGAAGGGGAPGTGGAGGAAPGKARGAISIDLRAPAACKATAGIIDLPSSAAGRAVTGTAVGELMTDDGFELNHMSGVTCSTIPAGGGRFIVSGKIFFDRPSNVYVSLDVTIGLGETPAGGFTLVHPKLPSEHASKPGNPCQFSVFALEAGKVWGQLTCPTLPGAADGSLCEIGPTYFYFESCKLKP